MKQSSSSRRRSRNNRRGGRTQAFDSNGPDVRIRGTAKQIYEKYLTMAKDAMGTDDIVMAENYFQHAEHYLRVMTESASDHEHQDNSDKKRSHGKNISENSGDITSDNGAGNHIGNQKDNSGYSAASA